MGNATLLSHFTAAPDGKNKQDFSKTPLFNLALPMLTLGSGGEQRNSTFAPQCFHRSGGGRKSREHESGFFVPVLGALPGPLLYALKCESGVAFSAGGLVVGPRSVNIMSFCAESRF